MDIDPLIAAALGFPKPQYVSVERERRWLCERVPRELIMQSEEICDLYVTGTRMRLREARVVGSGEAMLRLTRKADVDVHTRLITSIYLPEEEFAVLAATLPGVRLRKLRHRLQGPPGVALLVDEFRGALEGLVMAEAEFATIEALAAFAMPDFALREVTDDARYTGGQLIMHCLPEEWRKLTGA